MGEDQVFAAGVDVDLLAERRHIHSRTLDMPARSAVTPRRFPENLPFFCGLPKREVKGIALVVFVLDTHALVGVFETSAAEFAVTRKTVNREIHVATLRRIRMSRRNEFGYKFDDVVYIACRFEPNGRVIDLKLAHKFVNAVNHHARVFERRYARLFGLCDDFVVNVRVIARIIDFVADFLEIFANDVVNESLIRMSDMSLARNSDSACVHIDHSVMKRLEIFFFSCESVVNFHSSFPVVVFVYDLFALFAFTLEVTHSVNYSLLIINLNAVAARVPSSK